MNHTKSFLESVNPATEETIARYEVHSEEEIDRALERSTETYRSWRRVPLEKRASRLRRLGERLKARRGDLARLMTHEMGKPIREALGEVDKCAWNCDYYAENAVRFLAPEKRESAASESYIQYTPIGPVLAVMPWNFPYWQVVRFAAPALMAGNTALLKHASNVCGCALALEELFDEAGYPRGAFQTLLIPGSRASQLMNDSRVAAATLTGSEGAGAALASAAGSNLKKTVLELGGSDPFIVLSDADLEEAAKTAVSARFQNTGQSCIAAKRFIVEENVFDDFARRFELKMGELRMGDPIDSETSLGPLARPEFRAELLEQVSQSVKQGARILRGGRPRAGRGYFFEPTLLSEVTSEMPAGCQELFGPAAALMRARNAEHAIQLANASQFGLGSSLWTTDLDRARRLSREIEAGQVFINGMVASDPRLPFGGVKRSGYGRELSDLGIREFVNIQTVWIGPAKEG